jgi:hypothetical protein
MRFPPCLRPFGPAPPTSAGRSSLPATPLRKCKNAKGRPPLAPASRLPNLPRFACADLRCATPFPFRFTSLQGWGYPSACSCYPPPSPGGVRHVHAAFQRGRARARTLRRATMNTATVAASSNVTPFAQNLKMQQPKQQTATADSERGNRRQRPSPYRATGAGPLGGIDRLPHRNGTVPQLLIRQHP